MSHLTPGKKSNTDPSLKDLWNTTWAAIEDATALIGQPFALDACARDAETAKADQFITPEMDALTVDWMPALPGAIWCNPPFSRKTTFLYHAFWQSRGTGRTICCMVPFEPVTRWWREFVSGKATVVYVPDGRYNFADPETKQELKGVNFASCFVVFTPLIMPTQYVEFVRGIGSGAANDNQPGEVAACG